MPRLARALSFASSLLALAACSGGGIPPSQTPLSPRFFAPQSIGMRIASDHASATGPSVFVADASANAVFLYGASGKKSGQIPGVSGFLATDSARNLYVLASSAAKIDVYAKPYRKPALTIAASPYAVDLSVSSASGLLAVTNIISSSGGPGSVALYKKGETTPCATVPGLSGRTFSAAFDAAGDVFVDGTDTSGRTLAGEIVGGCAAKSIVPLTLGNTIDFPGAIAVDGSDRIAIEDQASSKIYTYARPKNGSLGNPVSTTAFSASDAVTFVFAGGGNAFWDVDAGTASVNEYAYPKGGSSIATLDSGGKPVGVAVVPFVKP